MTTVDKSTKLYSTFDPRIIPDCTLWLDANDSSTITKSGSNVSTWRDKSSKGFNATNGSSTGPTTVTSGNVTYLSFNGSTNFLQTSLTVTANKHSILIVYKPNQNNGTSNSLLRAQGGVGYIVFPYYIGSSNCPYVTSFDGSGVGSLDAPNSNLYPTASTTSHNVVAITIASGAQAIYNNGTSKATNTQAISSTTSDVFYIGAWVGTQQLYFGELAEVIIYARTITSTERQYLEGYLAWKWGLQGNLAVGHPYISRNPTFSPFRPTDISNCALWLDAIDASTITGTSNVTQWNDKSGNGRNFTATTGPSYSSNTMTFNGSTQRLENTAWNNFSRINHTLIAVHKPDTNTAYVGNTRLISIQQTAGTPYVVFPYLNNTTPNGYINDGNASTNPAASGKTLLDNSSTSAYNIITASISGSAQVIYNNGTVQDTQAYSISDATVTTGVNIGNQYAEWYKGSVKEIIIYTSALAVGDVNTIEGYLAWKWGLQSSLPSTHPYKNFYPLKIN